MISQLVICIALTGAGFTQKEIDALPKPDPIDLVGPDFFTRQKPAAAAAQGLRTPRQQELLAAKARRRRQRTRMLDSRPGYDADVEYCKARTNAFASRSSWRYP